MIASQVSTNTPRLIEALMQLPQDWALTPTDGGKRPYLKNWQVSPLGKERLAQEIRQGDCKAIGVLCGSPSGGLLFFDHDGPSADSLIRRLSGMELAQACPPTVGVTSGRPGRYQLIYRVPQQYWKGIATKKNPTGTVGNDGKPEQIEFRWDGCQSVVTGRHPVTGGYRWLPGQAPWEIEIAEAPLWMIEQMLTETSTASDSPTSWQEFDRSFRLPIPESIPLLEAISKETRAALEGNYHKGRNDTGAAIARDLLGTATHLESIGQGFEGDPEAIFFEWCCRVGLDRDKPAKQPEALWRSALKDNPGPSRSPEAIEGCIKAWKWRQIKAEPPHKQKLSTPKAAEAPAPTGGNKLAKLYYAVEAAVGSRLKLNALTQEIELAGEPILIEELRLKLSLDYNLSVPRQDCWDIVAAIAKKNQYHPVREYLSQVASQHPDAGIELLDQVAGDLLGAGAHLAKIYLRRWFVSAVARALDPGCKVDTALILQGDQGENKSSFFRALMPDSTWFSDSMGDIANKDEVLKMHLAWINEWAELEAIFGRRESSQVKAFLSSSFDLVRPPYGRSTQRFKRQSLIVGTSNRDDFLSDATGSRRFWVVRVGKRIDLEKVKQLRDHLWAAAVHAYRRGEQWWLTPEEQSLSSEQNQEFTFTHPWMATISAYVEGQPWVTTNQVLDSIKPEVGQQGKADLMAVADCLKQLGWRQAGRTRIAGKISRKWLPPTHWEVADPTPDPTYQPDPTSELEVGSPSSDPVVMVSESRSNLTNLEQIKNISTHPLDMPKAELPTPPAQETEKTEVYREMVGSGWYVGSGQAQQGFQPYQPRSNPPQQRLDHPLKEVGSGPEPSPVPVIVEVLRELPSSKFNPATRKLESQWEVKLSDGTLKIAFESDLPAGSQEIRS